MEADSHLALMEPVITYKRHGRVYCPGNQQAGSRGSPWLANRAERLPTRPLPGKCLSGLHIRTRHIVLIHLVP